MSRGGITRKRKANPRRGQESDGPKRSDNALGNRGARFPVLLDEANLLLDAHDIEAVGLGTKRERGVVGRHDQISPHQVLPQQGSGKMNCVECAEFGRHWLGGSIEDDGIDFHEFERSEQAEDRRSACRHLSVGESGAETKSIERPETLSHSQRAGDAPMDLPPLWQGVWLAKGHPQQH